MGTIQSLLPSLPSDWHFVSVEDPTIQLFSSIPAPKQPRAVRVVALNWPRGSIFERKVVEDANSKGETSCTEAACIDPSPGGTTFDKLFEQFYKANFGENLRVLITIGSFSYVGLKNLRVLVCDSVDCLALAELKQLESLVLVYLGMIPTWRAIVKLVTYGALTSVDVSVSIYHARLITANTLPDLREWFGDWSEADGPCKRQHLCLPSAVFDPKTLPYLTDQTK